MPNKIKGNFTFIINIECRTQYLFFYELYDVDPLTFRISRNNLVETMISKAE